MLVRRRHQRWEFSSSIAVDIEDEEKDMARKQATRDFTQGADSERKTAQYAEQSVTTGAGGEVHQSAGGDTPALTTQQGIPVADDQNSLKIGTRGPTALEDFHFREKIFHFDH